MFGYEMGSMGCVDVAECRGVTGPFGLVMAVGCVPAQPVMSSSPQNIECDKHSLPTITQSLKGWLPGHRVMYYGLLLCGCTHVSEDTNKGASGLELNFRTPLAPEEAHSLKG